MKKILFMAAALAVFTACSRTDDSSASFTSGDLITLTASFDMPETKARPDDPTSETVKFHWESGDYVLITNETGSSKFTIKDGSIVGNKASFTGKALENMKAYTVYYGIDPSETASRHNVQYIPESFTPKVSGEGSGTEFCLNNFYPVLKLRLDGNVKLGKIECSIDGDTTVMSFPEGLQLTTDITAVYFPTMHVSSDKFTIDFFDSDGMPLRFLGKKSEKTLKDLSGKIVTMPGVTLNIDAGTKYYIEENTNYGPGASCGGVVWAPVNCGVGYNNAHPGGLLYQWGRKYGQEFQTSEREYSPLMLSPTMAAGQSPDYRDYIFKAWDDAEHKARHNWWSDSVVDLTLWNSNGNNPDAEPVKTEYDPCPDGWRVPSGKEIDALYWNIGEAYVFDEGTYIKDFNSILFMADDGTTAMVFPESGCIGGYRRPKSPAESVVGREIVSGSDTLVYECLFGDYMDRDRKTSGYYWSSSAHVGKTILDESYEPDNGSVCEDSFSAQCLFMDYQDMRGVGDAEPFVAQSVRCVQEKK